MIGDALVQKHISWAHTIAQKLRTVLTDADDIVVAGGAVRDLAHGRIPKDYDLFWIGPGPMEQTGRRIEDITYDYAGLVSAAFPGSQPEVFSSYREDSSIEFVIKFEVDGVSVDLICYGYPKTPLEQVRAFDCTLNSLWIGEDADGNPHIALSPEAALVFTRTQPPTMLPLCDGPEARREYLASKYPTYFTEESPCEAN